VGVYPVLTSSIIYVRFWYTPLFSECILAGIQQEPAGSVLHYEFSDALWDGLQHRLHERVGTGILLKPRTSRTVFEVFLADVRMLSRARAPRDLIHRAVDDMIDRWNYRSLAGRLATPPSRREKHHETDKTNCEYSEDGA